MTLEQTRYLALTLKNRATQLRKSARTAALSALRRARKANSGVTFDDVCDMVRDASEKIGASDAYDAVVEMLRREIGTLQISRKKHNDSMTLLNRAAVKRHIIGLAIATGRPFTRVSKSAIDNIEASLRAIISAKLHSAKGGKTLKL